MSTRYCCLCVAETFYTCLSYIINMCITSAFESFNKIGITCVRVIEAFYLQKSLFTSKHYNDLGVKHTLDNKVC